MTILHKLGVFGVFLALILLSSCICGAYAQNNTNSTQNNQTQSPAETGQVPAPSIESNPVRSGETGCGITVISGDFNSNWYAVRGDGSPGNNLEGLYSNIQYDIGNSQMCFETQLASRTMVVRETLELDNQMLLAHMQFPLTVRAQLFR